MGSAAQKYHTNLSYYFKRQILFFDGDEQKQPNVRKCIELPSQQTKAELWDEVTETICNLDFIQAKAAAKLTFELIMNFNDVLEVIPENAENIKQQKVRQSRMEKYAKDLIAFSKGEIGDLEIPETAPLWSKEDIEIEIERIKTNPSRLDRLKDFTYFFAKEAFNLQKYCSKFQGFATQQAWNYADKGPVGSSATVRSSQFNKFLLLLNNPFRPVWNPIPQVAQTLIGHNENIESVAINPVGKWAVSVSTDHTYIFWNLDTGEAFKKFKGLIYRSNHVDITPDGKWAISAWGHTCVFCRLGDKKVHRRLERHTDIITSVAITPDGKWAITGSIDKTCILWELDTGKAIHILEGHRSYVYDVSITPDGRLAISGSNDKTCILWDLKSGDAIKTLIGHTGDVHAVSISPDGRKAISGSWDKTCIIWDLIAGDQIKTLEGHKGLVNAVAITPNGKRAISGCSDKTCILWDLESGKVLRTLNGHNESVNDVAITPDGKQAISSSEDKTCILWNLVNGETLNNPAGDTYYRTTVNIKPDYKRVISGCKNPTYMLWQTTKTEMIGIQIRHNYANTPDMKRAFSIASSPRDDTCFLWDLNTGKEIQTYEGHMSYVQAIAISPDGKYAISASSDQTCFLWDLTTDHELHILQGHTDYVNTVSITPDGKRAISGSNDNTCIVWDLNTGKKLNTLRGHTDWIKAVSITPDGRQAISSSFDNTCIIWDLKTGEALRIHSWNTYMGNIAISIDGKRAISVNSKRTCILWDLDSGKAIQIYISNEEIHSVKKLNGSIILGCESGKVIILNGDSMYLCDGTIYVTIRKIWDFELRQYQPLSADCPLCGHRFAPPTLVLATIAEITNKAGLRPGQSPCLELPDEAWKEPGLLGECPKCGKDLKFNPFIAVGDL